MVTNIPNELSNRVLYAGFESIPGDAVAPTFRLLGEFDATEDAALNRTPETTGGYDRFATVKRSPSTFAGTYGEGLTYETLPQLARLGVRRGDTGILVGGSTAAHQYTKSPAFDTDDMETATVQFYVPGLGFQATGVRFNEWTITMDADDASGAWQFSSNLFLRGLTELPGAFDGTATSATANSITQTGAAWTVDDWVGAYVFLDPGSHIGQVRQVVANTIDTLTVDTPFSPAPAATDTFRIEALFPAGLPLPTNETIDSYGTRVYLDPVGAIGTTDVSTARVISANITQSLNLSTKRFLGNAMNEVSPRVGKGDRIVSGQVRLEFDRRDEWLQWKNKQELAIRFEQTGSEIDSGVHKRARIDIPRAVWDTVSRDSRESNLTATFAFLAYLPTSAPIYTIDVINALPTLP